MSGGKINLNASSGEYELRLAVQAVLKKVETEKNLLSEDYKSPRRALRAYRGLFVSLICEKFVIKNINEGKNVKLFLAFLCFRIGREGTRTLCLSASRTCPLVEGRHNCNEVCPN